MSLKPLTGSKVSLKQFVTIHGLPETPCEFEPPTKKQRKAIALTLNQVIARRDRKGPFDNFKDNEQYFIILNTLETIYWNNNNNDTAKCSSLSAILIPAVILELIAEYSTGKIYDCWCKKKSEILVMNDDSIYPSDNECFPTICCIVGCHNVIFDCHYDPYGESPNKCAECEAYLCDNCMNECREEHPCCDDCLLTCAGDACVGASSICTVHNREYLRDTSGEYDNWGIKNCGSCYQYYCGDCASLGDCRKCRITFCSQCCPDWFCSNEECDNYICIKCNEDRMSMCEVCQETYCKTCIKTCKKCGRHFCLDDGDEFVCNQCVTELKSTM